VDVTDVLSKRVAAKKLKFAVGSELADKDPAPGKQKVLQLEYRLDGVTRKRIFSEGDDFEFYSTNRPNLVNRRYLPSPYLRKDFAVKAPVKRAVIYVSAQGVVNMHLNGQRVGDEFFTPGWTDYRKRIYYRTYDVTELVKQGDNTIGAILGDGWFRGNISNKGQNQYGDKIRLLLQLCIDYDDGSSYMIASDPSWKASFGPILQSDMHAGETYDARREMSGWDQPGFDDSHWDAVKPGSALNEEPLIEAYPGAPVRRTQELPIVKLTEPMPGIHVFDLGQNFSGWVRLKISGQAGDEIVMRFGEMLNPDG
jgi:alpha-L-rhamnosidase